ncbi:hypothetical protein QUB33_23370, partial [Microcoleus sp. B3-A4]|uniref:hypothetical protein n=1 Tax=Microcoleus sp. B3-A4 TaxID=2818653 RepID=UPI002FD1537E
MILPDGVILSAYAVSSGATTGGLPYKFHPPIQQRRIFKLISPLESVPRAPHARYESKKQFRSPKSCQR